jgi:hypothetical protein
VYPVLHLVRRFFFSLRPGRPDPVEEAWLLALLTRGEQALYEAQPDVDKVHALRCAAAIRRERGDDAPPELVAASSLHDVGKADSGLGTVGRVVATLCVSVLAEERVSGWSEHSGLAGRVGRYATHAELGALALSAAGSHDLVVAWSRHHHHEQAVSIAPADFELLRRADLQ